ncbi:hypothetical protein GGR57DRAFT_506089 [Xylariaceae sp. FL1272]|nr:hypothetical protein GGR57DRAFT_506089 [Xylariaceae sp. FL1272]
MASSQTPVGQPSRIPKFVLVRFVHRDDISLGVEKYCPEAKTRDADWYWKVEVENWPILKTVRSCPGWHCADLDKTPFFENGDSRKVNSNREAAFTLWKNTIRKGAREDFAMKHPQCKKTQEVRVQIYGRERVMYRQVKPLGPDTAEGATKLIKENVLHSNRATLGHLAYSDNIDHIVVEYFTELGKDRPDTETLPITPYFGAQAPAGSANASLASNRAEDNPSGAPAGWREPPHTKIPKYKDNLPHACPICGVTALRMIEHCRHAHIGTICRWSAEAGGPACEYIASSEEDMVAHLKEAHPPHQVGKKWAVNWPGCANTQEKRSAERSAQKAQYNAFWEFSQEHE